MKKLTATFKDVDVEGLDVGAILAKAVDFKLETVLDEKAPSKPRTAHRVSGKTAADSIMDHFSPGADFTRSLAMQWVQAAGYASGTYNSAINRLMTAGLVRSLGSHKFQFVKEK